MPFWSPAPGAAAAEPTGIELEASTMDHNMEPIREEEQYENLGSKLEQSKGGKQNDTSISLEGQLLPRGTV